MKKCKGWDIMFRENILKCCFWPITATKMSVPFPCLHFQPTTPLSLRLPPFRENFSPPPYSTALDLINIIVLLWNKHTNKNTKKKKKKYCRTYSSSKVINAIWIYLLSTGILRFRTEENNIVSEGTVWRACPLLTPYLCRHRFIKQPTKNVAAPMCEVYASGAEPGPKISHGVWLGFMWPLT